jgi:hypothetical protein
LAEIFILGYTEYEAQNITEIPNVLDKSIKLGHMLL